MHARVYYVCSLHSADGACLIDCYYTCILTLYVMLSDFEHAQSGFRFIYDSQYSIGTYIVCQ